ncbi:MAG TPA: cytochrome c oxidase subunit 3 [Dehalococcoidia bacterium]
MAVQAATHGPTHVEVGMSRGMAGMVLFIASEIMLFGGLFAGYFYMRNQADAWPPEGVHELDALAGGILTAILVISGVIAHMGVVGAKGGNHSLFILGIVGAIALGTIFIAGQAYEWFNLMDEGLTAKSGVYGSTFFVMTGFHGAHVIAGLAMLLVVFVRALSRDFTPTRHLFVDASVLYWHFVDVVWVFLYAILYVLV